MLLKLRISINLNVLSRRSGTMILCVCRRVSEREVDAAVRAGARSVDAVGARCGAGTDCGSCREAIEERLEGCSNCPRSRDSNALSPALASASL